MEHKNTCLPLIEDLSNAFGPSGFEDDVLAVLRFMDGSIVCSPRYQRYVLDLAEQKGLAVQTAVRTAGANDASIINTACDGIPAVVAGIPVRYTHTSNCLAHLDDFEATVSLAVETVCALTPEDLHAF